MTQENHKSKLHKGFDKQCKRQDSKPSDVKINLPVMVDLPKNFKGKYTHRIRVSNSKWNGMNLKCLRNRFNINRVGGMYGWFIIGSDGKYKLSMHGKQILKKKRAKKNNLKTEI